VRRIQRKKGKREERPGGTEMTPIIPLGAALLRTQPFCAQALEHDDLQACPILIVLISGQKYENSRMPAMQGRPNKSAVS